MEQLGSMVAVLVALLVFVLRLNAKGGPQTVFDSRRQTILDYQRGVRFAGGKPQELLGPGSHRYKAATEQINVVDLRDQPIIVERLAYPDSAGDHAWVSISAAIRVADVSRAMQYHDHVNEALVLIRDALRGGLTTRRASEARRDRRGCEQELRTRMASELEKIGLTLTGLEITEVSSPARERAVGSGGVQ